MKYLLGDNIQPFKSYLNFLTFCLSIQEVKICFSIKITIICMRLIRPHLLLLGKYGIKHHQFETLLGKTKIESWLSLPFALY